MLCVDRIEYGVNGYIFGINNVQELVVVLLELISDKSLIYKKGKAAQLTSSEYGYTYNVKAIEALLR